ncbi:putative F-box associated domain, type 3 [Helianthus anomalus]
MMLLNSWREVVFSVGSNDPGNWFAATFCGQCLYFVVTSWNFESLSWIVCFDVKTESLRKIQFPSVPVEARGNLVVLNGCIHLCVSYTINKENYRNLWRMDGDG